MVYDAAGAVPSRFSDPSVINVPASSHVASDHAQCIWANENIGVNNKIAINFFICFLILKVENWLIYSNIQLPFNLKVSLLLFF
tara:strand:- start:440 stop:691 length:252 start_codon:yes stop_codon:yes gene_type:complete